jgi:hypothetical protein
MVTTLAPNSYLQRLVGAAALDRTIYEEVEADARATMQAAATVLLSSAAAGIGSIGFGGDPGPSLAVFAIIALMAWAAWALLVFEIGVRIMPQPGTRSNVGELMRTLGFAAAPGILRVFGVIPEAAVPVFALTAVWMLAAMVVAVRQALDYESTARAIVVCGLGWVLATAFAIVLGLAFGPALS